ncbi:hypothetical protein B0G62_10467 [Paraburkholderia eburnea]|uniref:Uncharacterized protein n=1 Tax=Paraburkholderia eburnea TaxID=1189126 RepID=A0A2S4MDD9_9BURK|nr:hypothetical protein [Paraburkholderia eburnea]POR52770.1 hypothetical protein B0G62_10467 [Paraburkholderia eburnea]PRZ23638.1 hypothetical protein BX588_10467 [Paraburkholderia eburnea]
MNKPKSKGATPRIGASVMVRVPFFAKPTVGICVAVFDEDPVEIAVQAFPLGRDSLQLPAVPFFASEPDAGVRSAAWPA